MGNLRVDIWIPLCCTPASSAWLRLPISHFPGLSALNHTVSICPHRMGVSRCTMWYPSPRLTRETFHGFRGEHYVGLMDSTGEAEFETGPRSSLSCSRCSSSPLPFHPSLLHSFPRYFFLYISRSLLPVFVSFYPSSQLLSPQPPLSFSSLMPFQSTTAKILSV